jgi:hypothetical protein
VRSKPVKTESANGRGDASTLAAHSSRTRAALLRERDRLLMQAVEAVPREGDAEKIAAVRSIRLARLRRDPDRLLADLGAP